MVSIFEGVENHLEVKRLAAYVFVVRGEEVEGLLFGDELLNGLSLLDIDGLGSEVETGVEFEELDEVMRKSDLGELAFIILL